MEGEGIDGARAKKPVVRLCEPLLPVGREGKGKSSKSKRFCSFEVPHCCVLGPDLS